MYTTKQMIALRTIKHKEHDIRRLVLHFLAEDITVEKFQMELKKLHERNNREIEKEPYYTLRRVWEGLTK